MSHADFVHLRVHSAYSLSEGAIKIKDLIKLCKKERMPAVAITDTGNLFGALEFASAAADEGVQPIIGVQLGLKRGGSPTRPGLRPEPDQLVLLAQNAVGYANLIKLVSQGCLENEEGHPAVLPLSALEGLTEGLIALTGGPSGPVGRLLNEGQRPAAEVALADLMRLFPDRLYVELMRHGLDTEKRIEAALIELADSNGLQLVATNECFFADDGMYEAHDALLCIAGGTYVTEDNRRRATPDHRFKSAAEMRALFADLPDAVDNTLAIARRCSFLLKSRKPLLPAFPTAEHRSEADELRMQAKAGLEERLARQVFRPEMDETERAAVRLEYESRLEFELGVIIQMKFPGYFLIVSDFIKWAKDHGIPVGPGRGSGAGSLVAWSLTITDLDPIRFGLLFERFLNPERVSMPDFDIDFCQDRRDEVIAYVQERYGRDRVAQIITFGKLQARAVLRDVGRVLQMPYGQVDKICKMVPNNPAAPVTLAEAIAGEPMLQAMRDEDESVAKLMDMAQKLEGLYRHASTHAAGVVISDRPLTELIPLTRDPKSGTLVTQFNMKYVEQAGLVKFDFLGLTTLTILKRAVELLERQGIGIDLAALPLDDRASYELMARGDTVGVFQVEGSGMRDALKRMKPDRIEDVTALVSLYRPGPMDNIPQYIKVKNGEEKPNYLHPTLEGILKETFGIIIYQEQVMQIAQVLSGYTLGGADLLRRAMGKKIKAEMAAQREAFIKGAVERGVDSGQAGQIFDLVDKFAGYGFNKSHGAAYALVAYHTAYMKANYPVEFLAASMTYSIANTDKLNVFRQEMQRLGIKLLPPDVNRSHPDFAVEKLPDGSKAIRYALAAIRNVGRPAMEAVVTERERNGPFKDPFDLARRVENGVLNKRQLENLINAGALDSLNQNRAQLFQAVDLLLRDAAEAANERETGQSNLFGGDTASLPVPALPVVAPHTPMEQLRLEFEAIGFYLSAHPLDQHAKALARLGVIGYREMLAKAGRGGSTRFRVAGIVTARQERTSAKGNRFAFLQLSDTTGSFETTVFSELLSAHRELMTAGQAVILTIDVQKTGDEVRLTCQGIEALEPAVENAAAGLRIFLSAAEGVPGLREALAREGRGRGQVTVIVMEEAREVELKLPGAWSVTGRGRAAIKSLPGVVEVQEV
ncbi:MAG TPA: DNA polymerase III subunit alpha [Alphaproteobacteria bacterium]|nr:DNA polymerase III subunit alpha [Alphaproteobacteria bacterium]